GPPVALPFMLRSRGQGLSERNPAPPQAVLYDAVTFRIEVTNNGNAPLTDVVMTDILPAGLEYDPEGPSSAEPPKEQKDGGTDAGTKLLTWNLGTLAPRQQRVIEYRAIAKKEGTFTIQQA